MATRLGLPKTTLQRYVKLYKANPDAVLKPKYQHSRVLNDEQEEDLAMYVLQVSKMFHGLTTTQARQLAYETAEKNGLEMPKTWKENKIASTDWLKAFMKRNSSLSIRIPEATSMARATAFNRHTIGMFEPLDSIIQKTIVTGARIYNLDESGLTAVQKVPKVIAEKGQKAVGQITSCERGDLVTICGIVSACGVALPPVMIFPRKNYGDIFLTESLEGTLSFEARIAKPSKRHKLNLKALPPKKSKKNKKKHAQLQKNLDSQDSSDSDAVVELNDSTDEDHEEEPEVPSINMDDINVDLHILVRY